MTKPTKAQAKMLLWQWDGRQYCMQCEQGVKHIRDVYCDEPQVWFWYWDKCKALGF